MLAWYSPEAPTSYEGWYLQSSVDSNGLALLINGLLVLLPERGSASQGPYLAKGIPVDAVLVLRFVGALTKFLEDRSRWMVPREKNPREVLATRLLHELNEEYLC